VPEPAGPWVACPSLEPSIGVFSGKDWMPATCGGSRAGRRDALAVLATKGGKPLFMKFTVE